MLSHRVSVGYGFGWSSDSRHRANRHRDVVGRGSPPYLQHADNRSKHDIRFHQDRGLYRHFGILTESQLGRERHVISLNPEAQLAEELLSLFCRGQQPEWHPPLSAVSAREVLSRARSGNHPAYAWTNFNCEHFLCFAFDVPLDSPQVRRFAALAAFAALSYALTRAG